MYLNRSNKYNRKKQEGFVMIIEEPKTNREKLKINTGKDKIIGIINRILKIYAIPYILVLLFVAGLNILGTTPLVYVMLAVATLFNVPLMLPLVISTISFLILKQSDTLIISYILTYVIYTICTVLVDIKGISLRYNALIKIVVAYTISMFIIMIFGGFETEKILNALKTILLIITLYPIFASGMTLILNVNKKIIFSAEEIISSIIVVALTIMPLAIYNLYNVSIVSIILTTLIILVSWQNDWRIGCTTAVAVSLIYLIITRDTPIILTIYIFSGLVAGLFNRFNKWLLAIVFLLGNLGIISVFSTELLTNSQIIELLTTAMVIILLPKNTIFRLGEILSSDNGLKEGYNNILGPGADMKNRAGSISEIFDSIVNYDIPVTDKTLDETEGVVKKYLEEYKKNHCVYCNHKHNCLENNIVLVSKHISSSLERGLAINKELFPEDCSLKDDIVSKLHDIYANVKLMRIVKEKEAEISRRYSEEYTNASNVVGNTFKEYFPNQKTETLEQKKIREELKFLGYFVYQDNIERKNDVIEYELVTDIIVNTSKAKQDIQKIVSEALGKDLVINLMLNSSKTEKTKIKLVLKKNYILKTVVKQINRTKVDTNSDSYIISNYGDNVLMAISSATGKELKNKELTNSLLKQLERTAKNKPGDFEIVNISGLINTLSSNGTRITLDVCVVNSKKEIVNFAKFNSAVSYIIKGEQLEKISKDNIKTKKNDDSEYMTYETNIQKNMFIIMLSEGAALEVTEKLLERVIKEGINLKTETELINKIIDYMDKEQNKIVLEDETIIVCKIL